MQTTTAPPQAIPLRRFRRSERLHNVAVRLLVADQYTRARRAEYISRLYRDSRLSEADVRASDRALRVMEGR